MFGKTKELAKRRLKIIFVISVVFLIVVGTAYIYYSWQDSKKDAEHSAVKMAESVVSVFNTNLISGSEKKNGTLNFASTDTYNVIKNILIDLNHINDDVNFVYLLANSNDVTSVKIDSNPVGEYNQPLISAQDAQQFFDGKTHVLEHTDSFQYKISVLVPIMNAKTQTVSALFGLDLSDNYLDNKIIGRVHSLILVIVCLLLLLVALYMALVSYITVKYMAVDLEENELLFRTVFEQAPVGVALVKKHFYYSKFNPEFARILCRDEKEMHNLNWMEITHPDDLKKDMEQFDRLKAGEIDSYTMEKRYQRPDGSYIWIDMTIAKLDLHKSSGITHMCMIHDIQDRKMAEEALRESERSKAVLLSNLQGMAYRCKHDDYWTTQFVSEGCYELTGYKQEALINNAKISYAELIVEDYRKALWKKWIYSFAKHKPFRLEYEIMTAQGERKWVLDIGQGVYDNDGCIQALEGIVIDITQSRKRNDRIQYMNDHDYMTGLYNRKYFEDAKERLEKEEKIPVSIMIADINGVRLINDAFGHAEGDHIILETAKLMQSSCTEKDVLARTGGDEFSILMPGAGREQACKRMSKIKQVCESYNKKISNKAQCINLSIGFSTKERRDVCLDNTEKEAEEYLHKSKLFERKSHHSAVLSSIMATMFARSQETEEHSQRISKLCKMVGEKLGFSQTVLDELQLFAMLHDIGKVGIDDRILNKPGKLTEEEWVEMRKHPEIGARIAKTTPELEKISEYILTHHERWDGKGYPRGISGKQIPLHSRILAVADAYDAMTGERIYKKALSKQDAIDEIKRNAGKQFDPEIAQLFIECMQKGPEQETTL